VTGTNDELTVVGAGDGTAIVPNKFPPIKKKMEAKNRPNRMTSPVESLVKPASQLKILNSINPSKVRWNMNG